MFDKLKSVFAVLSVSSIAFAFVSIVGFAVWGYPSQAVLVFPLVVAYATTLCVGLVTAIASHLAAYNPLRPEDDGRFEAWTQVALWTMWTALLVGTYLHPSDELREAMEARASAE